MDFFSLDELAATVGSSTPEALASDQTFWDRFALGYDRDPTFSQLNYGYYHPSLRPVLDVEVTTMRELNRRGSHFKTFDTGPLLEGCRTDLARLLQSSPEEVAVVRSSSEGLNMVLQGLDLGPGDEVIASDHDYVAVEQALGQEALRDGVTVKRVSLTPELDDAQIVARFAALLTNRTRLMIVTHLIHYTGQILPAAELCDLGRQRGVPVLVDAAHSFGQLPSASASLGCDYLVASLHKWLGAPLGSGLLYVRRDRIASLRPFYGDTATSTTDIRKLERLGNRPDSVHGGLREAVRWHEALTTPVKQARLARLQSLWAAPLRRLDRVRVHTPEVRGHFGAIGLFTVQGLDANTLQKRLYEQDRIFTAVQTPPSGPGLRIVPGLATSELEIEALVAAVKKHLASG